MIGVYLMSNQLSECLPAVLVGAYIATGVLFAGMYVPKLRCMLRDPGATAKSHSPATELMWTLCRFVSLLYVGLIAAQPVITLVVLLDLLGRIASVALLLRARRKPAFQPV